MKAEAFIKSLKAVDWLKGEVFLADNFSVSASHGIYFASFDSGAPGADSQTLYGTLGNNFTEVGFHMYLWGTGH